MSTYNGAEYLFEEQYHGVWTDLQNVAAAVKNSNQSSSLSEYL